MQNPWRCLLRSRSVPLLASIGLTTLAGLWPNDWLPENLPVKLGALSAVAQEIDEVTNIQVYETASPAVVTINANNGNGTGTLMTPTGLILTNAHVVGRDRSVQVRLADGRVLMGDVVGYARDRVDLAAVQLRGNLTGLPTIQLAPAGSVKVGQRAFVIGNPFGLAGTFTLGIVSRIDPDRGLIQTDAAINPGNSGGPLLDSNARLVGVNTSIFTTEQRGGNIGISFAIPVQEIQPFLTAVQNGTAAASSPASANRGRTAPELIRLNNRVIGQLDGNSDVLPDGSYYDAYIFEGQQGQRVEVEMVSQELDAYLILLSQGNDLLYQEDDDSAGNFNARLEATLPASGFYIIIANAYTGGQEGRYSLQLRGSQGQNEGSLEAPLTRPMPQPTYVLRQSGQLSQGDEVATDGSLFDRYSFEGVAGQSITLALESADFDTYLVLMDASGQILAQNNNAEANSTNSRLTYTLPANGTYSVIVNGYSANDRGRYRLVVR